MRCTVAFALLAVCAGTSAHAAAAQSTSGTPNLDALFAAGSYKKAKTVEVHKQTGDRGVNSMAGRGKTVELLYLTLRGLAELPVLIMEVAGQPYHAVYYGSEAFGEVKPTLPYGRVPVLTDFAGPSIKSGQVLAQSSSIVRFLATQAGFHGHEPHKAALIDSLFETHKELFQSHARWGKPFQIDSLQAGIKEGKSCKGSLDFKV
jgi:hypothetical protein